MLIRAWTLLTATLALAGCSSLTLVEPTEETYFPPGSGIAVIAVASPEFTSSKVTINGNDVTSQLRQVSPQRIEGSVAVAAGLHTLVVDATVPCSTCATNPSPVSVRRQVCVLPPGPSSGPSKIEFSVGSGQSWGVQSPALPRVISNGVANVLHWEFVRLGSAFSSVGLISSIEAPCRCLRSSDPVPGALIAR